MEALHALTGLPRMQAERHLGVTVSRIDWRTEIAARIGHLTAPAGGTPVVCAVPAEITLTLVQAEHRVRIARELAPGSCLFAEVETHERRHVAVNRDTLRAMAARARAVAQGWARTAEGRGATPEAAAEALRQGLRRALEPVLDAVRQTQERRHAAIDTQDEYRRLARVCADDHALLSERLRSAAR